MEGVAYSEEDSATLIRIFRISQIYNLILNAIIVIGIFCLSDYIALIFLNSNDIDILNQTSLAIKLLSLHFIPYGINCIFKSYYQSTHNLKLIYFIVVLESYVIPAISIFLLSNIFGFFRVCLGHSIGEILTLLCLSVYIMIKHKKIAICMSNFLILQDSFNKDTIDIIIITKNDVINASHSIALFVKKHNLYFKKNFIALCVE